MIWGPLFSMGRIESTQWVHPLHNWHKNNSAMSQIGTRKGKVMTACFDLRTLHFCEQNREHTVGTNSPLLAQDRVSIFHRLVRRVNVCLLWLEDPSLLWAAWRAHGPSTVTTTGMSTSDSRTSTCGGRRAVRCTCMTWPKAHPPKLRRRRTCQKLTWMRCQVSGGHYGCIYWLADLLCKYIYIPHF